MSRMSSTTMQKPLYFLSIVLFLLIITGCRQHSYDRMLVEADSLMERQPDSALHLLEDNADVMRQGDEATRAYYTLLLTQARYKCYQPVSADSLIASAVRYYEQSSNNSLLCRAYYYRAMTRYEQGDHEEALRILKKGEQLAVHRHDLLYMTKYHESLCMVNYQANYHDMMLEYAKKFLKDAIQLKDTAYIARGIEHTANAYSRLGDSEKGKESILKTLPLLSRMSRQDQAYILTNIGCFYHQQDSLILAKHYLQLSLATSKRANTYAVLGDIFAEENNMTEAEKCWNEALKSDNPTIIINTLESMSNQYKERKEYARAFDIQNQIYQIKDSLTQASEQATLAEIQHNYDHQVVENKYYKTLTWLFGSVLLLVIVSVGYYYYHKKTVRRYTNQLTAKEESIRRAQQKIALLENMDGEHHEEIMALNAQIQMMRQQTYEQLGRGKEVYDAIAEGQKLQSVHDEHSLIEYYSVLRYETYDIWMNEYQDLTSRLLTYLILKDMGKSDAEIQETLSITNSSLRSLKTRLKARLRNQ